MRSIQVTPVRRNDLWTLKQKPVELRVERRQCVVGSENMLLKCILEP